MSEDKRADIDRMYGQPPWRWRVGFWGMGNEPDRWILTHLGATRIARRTLRRIPREREVIRIRP